jgi:hypothetical protein
METLPFVDTDTWSIGYSTKIADKITLSINQQTDFLKEIKLFFLEDKTLKVLHNLKEAPYTFTSAAGAFNDRFVLYFAKPLGTNDTVTSLFLRIRRN